ncbi:transposase [Streptomyces sp. NPDC021098]|uniref:transposase n=1 Tax=unclassified Streptomyces TaxID=2593676 RepID=UPI0037A4AA6B
MDSQTVHASLTPKETTGLDPGTKSRGRKRGSATDVLGLLIAVIVIAASMHDNTVGIALLDKVAADNPSVVKSWVDVVGIDDRRRRLSTAARDSAQLCLEPLLHQCVMLSL